MRLSIMIGRILTVLGVLVVIAANTMPAGAAPPCTIRGTQGSDVLTGGSGPDVICGRGGNDVLRGLGGDDTLLGGDGDDVLEGGPGNDSLLGEAGVDTVSYTERIAGVTAVLGRLDGRDADGRPYSAGNGDQALGESDRIFFDVENLRGGAGPDTLTGGAAQNVLEGGAGADTVAGGAAIDRLHGGPGDDDLSGDSGDDVFVAEATRDGADVMRGGDGDDAVTYGTRNEAVVVTTAGGADDGAAGEGDDVRSVVVVTTGAGADTLIGSEADDTLVGQGGDDHLDGAAGADLLRGGAGNDNLRARDGARDGLIHCGTGVDRANIDAADPAPVECETVTAQTVADLSIALTDQPDPARLTQSVDYDFTVQNAGPDTATSVTVATTLPAGASAAPAAGCSAAGQVVTCSLPDVPAGGSEGGTLSVTYDSTGTKAVTSTVGSSATDPDPADNEAAERTTVTEPLADLSVSLSDSPDPVAVGAGATYTATVTNHGPDAADGAFVTFDVPAGGIASGCTAVLGGRRCELGTIAPGASQTAGITISWSFAGTVEVTAHAGSATVDPNAANDADVESTAVGVADLALALRDDPDPVVAQVESSLYTVDVRNAGPQTAEGVSVVFEIADGWGSFANPAGCSVVFSPTRMTCALGDIAPGATRSLSFDLSWRDAGDQTVKATATAARPGDPDLTNNTEVEHTTVVASSSGALERLLQPLRQASVR